MESDELRIWLNHFEYHAEHPRCVPGGLTDHLTSEERSLIARSIATFQLGEQSEGATLLAAAERFARVRGTPALARIVELFIAEEQRHAALLREFMQDHGIALRQRDWTDEVFRFLRRRAGLELYLYVLISAELIGKVYYRALEGATGCQRLRVLCRVLVCDELAHVGFESQLLLALRSPRPAVQQSLTRMAHRAFIAGTALIVWLTHRAVLRRAGHSARSFLRTCLAQYAFYLEPPKTSLAP
ncbi:MAG TPA: hypothetical protein VKT19_03435, partial [Steroidobacteraceae bacterium]|nr:hypothetical protein [Steroidobacteraceae bacterium]